MKMKRYFAADARLALRQLREDQGPDAVIISNRKVTGGVEIIAALDYEDALINASLGNPMGEKKSNAGVSQSSINVSSDNSGKRNNNTDPALGKIQTDLKGLRDIIESPFMQFAWGEMGRVQPMHARLLKQLMMLGLSAQICEKIADKVAKKGLNQRSWLDALALLAKILPVAKDELLSEGGAVALIGPTGVGKTTTIAKLAARYALRHGRRNVALVTTDSYRIGAHEQLRTYGRILGIPVQVVADCDELSAVLNHGNDKKLTLIDTAGISQRDINLSEKLAMLDIGDKRIKNYLVLSATSQGNLQRDVVKSFGKANLHGCIVTKLDEATSLGETFSVLIQHKLPVAYVSDGQKVPDDLRLARGNLLVKESIKLMQMTRKTPSEQQLAYMFGRKVSNASI